MLSDSVPIQCDILIGMVEPAGNLYVCVIGIERLVDTIRHFNGKDDIEKFGVVFKTNRYIVIDDMISVFVHGVFLSNTGCPNIGIVGIAVYNIVAIQGYIKIIIILIGKACEDIGNFDNIEGNAIAVGT